MKLKKGVRMVLRLIMVYAISGVVIFAMSQRIERLNEIERQQKECNVAVKIDK